MLKHIIMNEEIWQPIVGFEGIYEISNLNRVKSLERTITYINRWGTETNRTFKSCIVRPSTDKNGYLFVTLKKNGTETHKTIHRLIAEAFIPNPENKPTVNHKNHIRTDNRIENLEWATYPEQIDDEWKNNAVKSHYKQSKQVYQYSLDNSFIALYSSIKCAAKKCNLSKTGIKNCCEGGYFSTVRNKFYKSNSYGGFKWSYTPLF